MCREHSKHGLLVQGNRQEEISLFAPEQRRPLTPLVNARSDKEGRNVVICRYPFYAESPGQTSNDPDVWPNTNGYRQVLMSAEILLELTPASEGICNQVKESRRALARQSDSVACSLSWKLGGVDVLRCNLLNANQAEGRRVVCH